jgi:hypothetical protein
MSPLSPSSDRLRVLFVTQDDPLYVFRFFEVFLAQYPRSEFEVVGITICRPFHESRRATARRMLDFYGTRDFLRVATRFAGARLRRRSIAALAKQHRTALFPRVR